VDPAATAVARDDVRLACLTALQVLPARQRAALVLCEVLRWRAAEAAELLGASEASVTSALQRARVTLAEHRARRTAAPAPSGPGRRVAPAERRRADRCADAFATQDLDSLLALLG
jgi:RNA polymerase sigma-70 factor (ECF subfamily)